MARRKWQFSTREAAEASARELQLQRDHLSVALNAVMHGSVRSIDTNYGTDEAYYRFGVISRIAGCIVLVTFYAPYTGQKPHTAAYWEGWVQEEIERFCAVPPDDALGRAYREGLYELRRQVHHANQCAA